MQDDFLKKLNKEQGAAVSHDQGPLLIIAGAGTGKTRVITSRILKLITDGRAKSDEILALTFTEKAAEEMVERVDVAMPLGYEEVWIKTFHGFCEKVLRESGHEIGLSRDYRLLAKLEQWCFMKKHLFDFELDYFRPLGNPSSFIDVLVTHFSRIKEEFISPDEYVAYATKKVAELMEKTKLSKQMESGQLKIDKKSVLGIEMEEVRKIMEAAKAYKRYQELMLAENFLDFGDLSYYVLKLFDERPSVLKHYQERFKYIMVDEFQDTNYAQFKLLLMLAGSSGDGVGQNVCVVGDDDQSIFRWRGASLSNILQFQKAFPEAEKIILTENYRSTQNILDASHAFIKFNDPDRLEYREKIPKDLKSRGSGAGEGGNCAKNLPIEAVHFANYADEVRFVVDEIKKLTKRKGEGARQLPLREVAVLVRANAHALPFAEELKKAGIPFQIKTPKGLLSLEEIKDVVALVRALADFGDDVAWVRLLKMPIFGIGMSEILNILNNAKTSNERVWSALRQFGDADVLSGMESAVTSFLNLMSKVVECSKNHTASEVIGYFLTESGYLNALSEKFDLEHQQKMENLTSFSKVVWQFEKVNKDNSIVGFAEFLKSVEESGIPLADDSESSSGGDFDAVQILTAHGAKGLEFDTVFVVNLVNGRFPILNKRDPLHIPIELTKEIFPEGDFHIEEERRLFYVALTRAKKKLILTYSDRYSGPKKWKRSQFLDEIAESKLITEKEGKSFEVGESFGVGSLATGVGFVAGDSWILKKQLSYSQIDTFKTCPLKYGYRYVLNVPTPPHHAANFGSSVHETLKDFYRVLMTDEKKATQNLLKELYESHWINSGYESKEHEKTRKEQGVKMLENFYDDNGNPWTIPAFIEKDFNLRIGEYMLIGRIDRIDKLPDGGYEVIDYKTGKGSDQLSKENKLQLYLYALACRDVLSIPVSKLSLYYLEDGRKLSMTMAKGYDELDSVKDDVLAYVGQMKESDFAPTPGFHCQFCDYRLICPAV